MKQLIFIFTFCPLFIFSQGHYQLKDVTVIQYDTVVYQGTTNDEIIITDSVVALHQETTNTFFEILIQPDEDKWQLLKSYASEGRPSYKYLFRFDYLDEVFKDKIKFEIDGKQRVMYHFIIDSYVEGASNNIRYAYTGYKLDE
ncbi:MAG: hypothetical protein H6588_08595 [Flavobacteriales bacterium]|nr:hypothetical protein [Flavobacteriales bacterium]